MKELIKANRQYLHNDGSGLVHAYDKKETEMAVKKQKLRIEKLEFALGQLINKAEECDGWECFPSVYIDNARGALDNN